MRAKRVFGGLGACLAAFAYSSASAQAVRPIPPSEQREGNAIRGARFFVEGDYQDSGPPLDFALRSLRGAKRMDLLDRPGLNGLLPYYLSAGRAWNDVPIVTPNCLVCHAQLLEGELVVGLGDIDQDYTQDLALAVKFADREIVKAYGRRSPEREAWAPFRDAAIAVGPHIRTAVAGANPADKLAFVLAAYRDPRTMQWSAKPSFALPSRTRVAPSDVPPLWGVAKKNALFYTGSGRGDFARMTMAASLMTVGSVEALRELEPDFVDVLAYLRALEAPPWPFEVDLPLATLGEAVFVERCAGCHGTYGEPETYPNLLVDLDVAGTDPLLAEEQLTVYAAAVASLNAGWSGAPPTPARLEPQRGYVAPPLDGVWATAPYLHNGSVPTLADLLDSARRPPYWERRGAGAVDRSAVGLVYERRKSRVSREVYDTTLPGYGNRGHTFGDELSDDERRALLEYLKQL